MMGTTARLVLFVSSYAPLFVLFAVLRSFGRGWPEVLCYAVAALGVLGLVTVWLLATRSAADFHHLTGSRSRDAEVLSYLVGYVVPFAAVDASTHTRIALGVFAVLLAALYLRAAVFYIHPLLLIAGLHVFDATTDSGVPLIVLTRRRVLPQVQTIRAVTIAPGVLVERGRP